MSDLNIGAGLNINQVKPGNTIAVWFSCGAASAVAAKKTIEKYQDIASIKIVNNPIKEEHEDNKRFLRDVERWLGVKIEYAINKDFPDCSCAAVWRKRKYMAGVRGAPCTYELKKKARRQWEESNEVDHHVLGFTYEEYKRAVNLQQRELPELLPILVTEKITKADCFNIINEAGIRLPEIYNLGYPNANCIGCVKAGSVTYWNHVRKVHPEVFAARAELSREIGAKLVVYKGKRIYLDELDPNAKGNKMKNMHVECGIFCEPQESKQ